MGANQSNRSVPTPGEEGIVLVVSFFFFPFSISFLCEWIEEEEEEEEDNDRSIFEARYTFSLVKIDGK